MSGKPILGFPPHRFRQDMARIFFDEVRKLLTGVHAVVGFLNGLDAVPDVGNRAALIGFAEIEMQGPRG